MTSKEEKTLWVFTFGVGSPYKNYVVKIYGTYDAARNTMFMAHGKEWAFQYSAVEGDKMIEKYGYKVLAELDAVEV